MKGHEIMIIETGSASDFPRLAVHVQGKLSRNRIIMNNDTWKGSVIKTDLDNGLSMHCWNCRLLKPVALYYTLIPGNGVSCSLAYNLNPGSIIFKNSSLHSWRNTFFSNHSPSVLFDLVPRKNIQFIYFSMTKDWLSRQFKDVNENVNESVVNYTSEKRDAYFSISTWQEYDAATELFEKIQTATGDSLSIQAKAFLLLSFFFENLLITKEIIPEHIAYFKKIRQVQHILHAHLATALPSLRSIAEQTGLNEASLKRYFKILYGCNIYAYYLQQKMDLAKRILVERNMNVNEVAADLGYKNVSSFIAVFKKHFGYQPGLIRKS